MNIIRQEIRTGLLVVVSLAILITLMLYLGSPGVFVPQKTFYIYVENAWGLKQGADVALAGRKIGQVVKLTSPVPEADRPRENSKMETMIEVRVNRRALIFKHVNVMVAQSGLLGEIFIDFTAGTESSGLAPDGSHFLGYKPPGLDQAVPLVLERLDPVLKSVGETLGSLQKTSDNLAALTSEKGEVPATLQEFRKVGAHLDDLSAPAGPLHETLSNIANLTGPDGKIQHALANIEQLTAADSGLSKTILNAEKLTSSLVNNDNIKLTLENTRKATGELNNTLTELRLKFGVIAENLNQATDTLKRQPWRLIWPSTKRYPEDSLTAVAHKVNQSEANAGQAAQTAKKAGDSAQIAARKRRAD